MDIDRHRIPSTLPLLVSGRDEAGLRAQAGHLAAYLVERPQISWTEARRSAALRPHLPLRAAIQADGLGTALEALTVLAAGRPHPAISTDRARVRAGLVFVFPGHGGHWAEMGRQLLEELPAFANAIAACDAALAPHTKWSVRRALRGELGGSDSSLAGFDVVQCTSFAMGFGLATAYREAGLVPDAIVGHSLGEMTAAVVAGAVSLEDGARLVSASARLVIEHRHEGGMVFVNLPVAEVEAMVQALPGLYVGTVDGPASTVASGDLASIRVLEQQLTERGVFHRRVKIAGAPHSPHMEALLPGLRAAASGLVSRATEIPMVSSITGERIDGSDLDADYWCGNLRSQVRFDKAIRTLLAEGMDTFVEIGPHPVLTASIESVCAAEGLREVTVLGTMRREEYALANLHRTLGALHNCGQEVSWSALFDEARGEVVALPAYLFPRELEAAGAAKQGEAGASEPADPKAELATLPMETRLARIGEIVREEMAAVLGRRDPGGRGDEATEAIAGLDAQDFAALGLDSLNVLDLKSRVSKRVGLRLPQQFLYDFPTLELATRAIAEQLAPAQAPRKASKPKLAQTLVRQPSLQERVELVLAPLRAQVCLALGREDIDAHDSLRQMGIDDVLGAELCLRVQRETGLRVFPREIVEQDTLLGLATHIAKAYGPYCSPAASMPLDELDARIASPYHDWPVEAQEQPSDQNLIFILSPPRSGSTLLRVMLAGHSALFSPQELYLAPFETMGGYDAYLQGTVLNMGLVGAIAEVISRTGSWNLYRQWVREARPTSEIYAFFRERIGDRILVDKSPFFFPPLAVLRRLERRYPKARFIHLVRHPVSCIGSYVQERFHGIFEETAELDPYDAAEWCWTRVHEGIGTFAGELSSSRFTQVFFEDLAEDPERVMRRLCPALGVDFEPAVLEPYSGHRMVAGGFQVGDPNFTRHGRIVADKSEAWREVVLPRPLQEPTLEVARRLGYDTGTLRQRDLDRSRPRSAGVNADTAMGGIGMDGDIHLPSDVMPKTAHVPREEPPRAVLLTGATGFLGAFLLAELMARTDAKVHCLVRARDPEEALARLRDNLGGYQLWRDEYAERIVTVVGDLGLPDMGLSDEEQADLAARVDAIYHCAAQVSWLLPYSHLREVNVGGLVRVLRLACRGDTLPVHYVSSLGTAFMRPFEYREMVKWVTQTSGLGTESILELPLGYIESKWVNMHIVKEARARGIPITLYAPGLIGGHSVSGVDSLSDSQFLHALIKGSTQLGGFPDAKGWRFIPVDQAAERIIRCSASPDAHNLDLYLDSTVLIDPGDMIEILRSHGYDVEQIPFAVWRQKVLDLADTHDTENALFGFTDVIYAFTPLRFMGQRLQMSWFLQNRGAPPAIREILGEQAFVSRALLQRLVDYYVRVGAMPPRPA